MNVPAPAAPAAPPAAPAMAGPVPAKRELEFTLETSQKILAAIKREILSTHDIIPEWEIPEFTAHHTLEYAEKFGTSQVLKLVQLYIKGREVRIACEEAMKVLGIAKNSFIKDLAVTKFGVGQCAEATTSGILKCCTLGAKVYLVKIMNSETISVDGSRNGHSFLFVNSDQTEIDKLLRKYSKNLFEFLSQMKHGFVLDPFIKETCEMDKFNSKDSSLLKYALVCSLQTVAEVSEVRLDSESRIHLQRQALEVYNKAQEILVSKSATQLHTDPRLIVLKTLEPALKDAYLKECVVYLETLSGIPNLLWKKNVKESLIWVLGPLDSISSVKGNLEIYNLRVDIKETKNKDSKGEAVYGGFIETPDLEMLKTLLTKMFTPHLVPDGPILKTGAERKA